MIIATAENGIILNSSHLLPILINIAIEEWEKEQ